MKIFSLFLFLGAIVFSPTPLFAEDAPAWDLYRGNAQATGVAKGDLPDKPELLWKFSIEKGGFQSTAAIIGGAVYIGGGDGKFYALNLADGKLLWSFDAVLGFAASPAVRNGRIYIGDMDGNFYCLDARKGEKIWAFQTVGEIDSSANFYAKPSSTGSDSKNNGIAELPSPPPPLPMGEGSFVLFGSQDAMLYCLDAENGRLAWKFEGGDQIRCFPTVLDHFAFVAGCDSTLSVIDLADGGKVAAKVPIESPTGCSPAILDGRVFFGTEGNVFLCVDPKEKKIVWRFEAEKHAAAFRSSAAVAKEAVVVGSRDKRVHALDPQTGKPLWSFAAKNRVDSSPVIVNRRVFVGSTDGRIYALDLKTGEKRWEYETGGAISASPAVAGGRLIIGNDQGDLFCFGAK
jgi:outer membrane protein assembly factor BamB